MPEFRIPNLRNGYVDLVRWVHKNGELVSPRGLMTSEITGALVVLDDVFDALPVDVGRGVSTGIAAVEACQLLAGVSTPKLVVDIGPIFKNFQEDNGEFHGAYGPRTAGQYEVMIERLKADPDTRQAVTTIWDKNYDLMEHKRDYPCTLTHTFHIRKNKLNMRTHMRSNDVIKGVGYDYFQFTRVQIAMAAVLGIEPGRYYHYADSLHLYHSDSLVVDRLHHTYDEYVKLPVIFGATWADVRTSALNCLTTASAEEDLDRTARFNSLQSNEVWYARAMVNAVDRNRVQPDPSATWVGHGG